MNAPEVDQRGRGDDHRFASASGLDVRTIYQFINAHQGAFPIEVQRKMHQVAVSGYHAWLKKPISDRALEDARGVVADVRHVDPITDAKPEALPH